MEYNVDKKARRLGYFVALIFSIGIFAVSCLVFESKDLPVTLFFITWIIFSANAVRLILLQPNKIVLDEEKKNIVFSGLFSKKVLFIDELVEVNHDGSELCFKFISTEVEISNQITGLHKLISELQIHNKNLKILGC